MVDRVRGVGPGRSAAAAGQRGVSQRQVAGDLDALAVVRAEAGGARLGGAAAEIFAVVGQCSLQTLKWLLRSSGSKEKPRDRL